MLAYFILYIFGVTISLLIYNIIVYEKYNNTSITNINKYDILKGTFTLFSWLYLLAILINKLIDRKEIMKTLKRIGKKLIKLYAEETAMQYKYYYE